MPSFRSRLTKNKTKLLRIGRILYRAALGLLFLGCVVPLVLVALLIFVEDGSLEMTDGLAKWIFTWMAFYGLIYGVIFRNLAAWKVLLLTSILLAFAWYTEIDLAIQEGTYCRFIGITRREEDSVALDCLDDVFYGSFLHLVLLAYAVVVQFLRGFTSNQFKNFTARAL